MVLWWLASVATAQTCPDRAVLTGQLREAVTAGSVDDASVLLDRVVESFGCGARAQSSQLVDLWLAVAALRDVKGSRDEADLALRSARRLGETFDDAYSDSLRIRWRTAHTTPILPSRLAVDTRDRSYPMLLVDGLRFEPPGLLEAGYHLVQWGEAEDDLVGARIVATAADDTTTIDVPYAGAGRGPRRPEPRPDPPDPAVDARPVPPEPVVTARPVPAEPPEEPFSPPPEPPVRERRPGLLVVAGVTGVASLLTAGLAAAVGPSANQPGVNVGDTLTQRFDRQRALGITSFGLMAVSGVTLGIHIQR